MSDRLTALLDGATARALYEHFADADEPAWDDLGDYERRRWMRVGQVATAITEPPLRAVLDLDPTEALEAHQHDGRGRCAGCRAVLHDGTGALYRGVVVAHQAAVVRAALAAAADAALGGEGA